MEAVRYPAIFTYVIIRWTYCKKKTMMVKFKSSKISLPAYPPVLSGYMVEFCDSFRDRVKVSRLLWPPFDFISKELTLRLPPFL